MLFFIICDKIAIMNNEWKIRDIRDRLASSIGEIDECASEPEKKDNYRRLNDAAALIHSCADDLQDVLMRIQPKKERPQ